MSKLSPYAAVKPGSSLPAKLSGIEPRVRESLVNPKQYITPPSSPIKSNPTTPVIVSNPSFSSRKIRYSAQVPIPIVPNDPEARLPESSGRWDNHSLTPSYIRGDEEFWSSRQGTIPITSTVSSPLLSELEFSPFSTVSTEVFDDNTNQKTVIGISQNSNTFVVNEFNMAVALDPTFRAELDKLEDLKDEVELSLSDDIPISRVNANNAELLRQIMNEAHSKAKSYALGMNKLGRKFPTLKDSAKAQYSADGKALLAKVNQHVDLLLKRINEMPAQQPPHIQPPPPSVQSQPRLHGDSSSAVAIIAKAAVKFTSLLNMAAAAKQDAEEDGLYLETASDEKISRLMQKSSKFEKLRDKISASYSDYLEFTAVHKPSSSDYDPVSLATTVTEATDTIDKF